MYFTTALIASLAISANALATPHVAGLSRRHQHAALAKARAPAPEPVAAPFAQPDVSASVPSKKQLRKRCKPRKSAAPTPSAAPVNVGADPASADTPSQSDKPTEKATPPPSPSPSPSPSKEEPAPKPSSKPEPKPAPKPQSGDPVTGGQSSSIFKGVQVGQGTFYGTGLGACGITNNDGDYIAAVSMKLFDKYPGYNGANPNHNPVCGKKVRATYQGKSVTVTITDRCTGCQEGDLDFSPTAFNQIADPAEGRISGLHWEWL